MESTRTLSICGHTNCRRAWRTSLSSGCNTTWRMARRCRSRRSCPACICSQATRSISASSTGQELPSSAARRELFRSAIRRGMPANNEWSKSPSRRWFRCSNSMLPLSRRRVTTTQCAMHLFPSRNIRRFSNLRSRSSAHRAMGSSLVAICRKRSASARSCSSRTTTRMRQHNSASRRSITIQMPLRTKAGRW